MKYIKPFNESLKTTSYCYRQSIENDSIIIDSVKAKLEDNENIEVIKFIKHPMIFPCYEVLFEYRHNMGSIFAKHDKVRIVAKDLEESLKYDNYKLSALVPKDSNIFNLNYRFIIYEDNLFINGGRFNNKRVDNLKSIIFKNLKMSNDKLYSEYVELDYSMITENIDTEKYLIQSIETNLEDEGATKLVITTEDYKIADKNKHYYKISFFYSGYIYDLIKDVKNSLIGEDFVLVPFKYKRASENEWFYIFIIHENIFNAMMPIYKLIQNDDYERIL